MKVKRNGKAIGRIWEHEKKSYGKKTIKDYNPRVTEVNQNQKVKTLIDFAKNNCKEKKNK